MSRLSLIGLAAYAAINVATASVLPPVPNDQDAATDRTILITSSPPQVQTLDQGAACLLASYYGTYGGSSATQEHIYLPSEQCLMSTFDDNTLAFQSGSGSIVPLLSDMEHERRIVWVGQAGVDPSLSSLAQVTSMDDAWSLISSRSEELSSSSPSVRDTRQQQTFSAISHTRPIRLLHQSPHSLLLHVPMSHLPTIDALLPSHLVPVALPISPLPPPAFVSDVNVQWETVPSKYVQNLRNITSNLKFSSKIDSIVSEGIEHNAIRRDVRWLTGEAPSGIESRHSFTPGAVKTANWIKSKVEDTGANCTLHPFLNGFSPNVICSYPSSAASKNETDYTILSAHYDSRGSFGSTRAPGGDDDGSGTGHLLAVAHAIGTQGVRFKKNVVLAFFAGEEQGLLGSHAFAEYLHSTNATVLLQVQADMLGYHAPGETLQLGLPESIHLPEASYLIGNLSQLYSPELVVGRTAACCSDHQSFVSYGYPATQVFERNGWIADPKYHNSGDLSQREGYDFEQIVSIAKVTLAALLTVAGFDVAPDLKV